MRTTPRTARVSARSLAIALTGMLVAGLAVLAGTTLASAQTGGMHMSADTSQARVGTTRGWLQGRTVKFVYSKNFVCQEPPTSAATSNCEVGAQYDAIPADEFDPLYVVVPIGFTPGHLQCPTPGKCIDHPRRIDLTRVFGNGTGNALLPPHSHIVTTAAGRQAEWWNVNVIGVTSQKAWRQIVAGKSYQTITRMRNNHNPHVTDNIASNLFLYFAVRP